MRHSLTAAFPRHMLLLSTLVLLLAAGVLGLRPARRFTERDAFVASLESGERQVRPVTMAREWRDDIAAQEALLRRDRLLAAALAGAGLLALLGFTQGRRYPKGPVAA